MSTKQGEVQVLPSMLLHHANSAFANFGRKRFDLLFMAPSSQRLEPPQNPGRFSLSASSVLDLQRRKSPSYINHYGVVGICRPLSCRLFLYNAEQ